TSHAARRAAAERPSRLRSGRRRGARLLGRGGRRVHRALPGHRTQDPGRGPRGGEVPGPGPGWAGLVGGIMGSAESSHGSTDKEFVEFDHWLYGAVLGTGYTQKAVSKGLYAGLYDQYLRGHYTPIRAATAQSYEDPIDLQMIHPVRGNREVLLSRITRGPPDERVPRPSRTPPWPAGRARLSRRNRTPDAGNANLNLVFELRCWGCGLPILTAMSETPRSSAMNFFNVVVAARGVRADSSWAILESALAEPVLPRVMDRDDVYQKLTATVRQSPDLAAAR